MESSKLHTPQEQVTAQSAELQRPQASSDLEKQIAYDKSGRRKEFSIPRYGLPKDYPEDDLFL